MFARSSRRAAIVPVTSAGRTVFDNPMVAHVWASCRQREGRSGNGNFYFRDRTLFSYGEHFPVGRIGADGVVLLNADRYSVSTSQHQAEARAAVRHMTSHNVPAARDLFRALDDLSAVEGREAAGTRLSRTPEHKTSLAARRAAVMAYVERYALALTDDAGAYLLRLASAKAGKADTFVRRFASIRAKAERRAEADKAAAAATKLRNERNRARHYAAGTDAEARAVMVANLTDHYADESTVAATLKDMRRAHRVASAAGWTNVKATIWRRIGMIEREAAALLTAGRIRRKNASRREALAAIRMRLPLFNAGTATGEQLASLGYAIRNLGERARAGTLYAAVRMAEANVKTREYCELVAKRAMEREAAVADWLAGGRGHSRLSDDTGAAMVRAVDVKRDDTGRIVGGTLETSHGADVPLPHALKAFAFVRRVVASGRPWARNGSTIRVGHFQVDRIEADGTMTAGCHRIRLAAMDALAERLGVADIAPSDDALASSH